MNERYFPVITNFTQVADAVRGRDEFIIIEKKGYKAIDYVFVLPDSFDDPICRECRGIKFYDNGDIMSRPFHKFFNVGEKEFTQPQRISMREPHTITSKMDGSMIHAALLRGGVVLMTRKGRTDIAIQAEGLLTETNISFLHDLLVESMTPIFEYTSPENRIVLSYEESALTLLAIRHNLDGGYYPHRYVDMFADRAGFPCVDRVISRTRHLGDFVHSAREETGIEGYVIGFESGFHVKIKTDEYVRIHKARDLLSREKDIIALCLNQEIDDFLPLLEPEDIALLEHYRFGVAKSVLEILRIVAHITTEGAHLDQKTFAVEYLPDAVGNDTRLRSLCFANRSEKQGAVQRMLKKMKVDEIHEWLPEWPDFPNFNTALDILSEDDHITHEITGD